MTTRNHLESKVSCVSKIFEGRFKVPWHQRYYDWDAEQVRELLDDIKEALDENRPSYFLGSIMLVNVGDVREINDGQQRLITLSLLFAALERKFAERHQPYDSSLKATKTIHRLLFDFDPNTVTPLDDKSRHTTRIEPPRHDQSNFKQIIRGHNIGTNGKLTSAWNEIDLFVKLMGADETGRFFDFITKKVEINILYVPPTKYVNAVFEALNARGKQLDDVDLIRNHLYSHFTNPADSERRQTVHERLERILQTSRSASRSQEYFRCFFQCRYGHIQKKRFYREARSKIRVSIANDDTGDYIYKLVDELADLSAVELFRTLDASNSNLELFQKFCSASKTSNKKRKLPIFIWELKRYTVARPIIFAMLRKFMKASGKDKNTVAKAVHYCMQDLCSFVMRVSFCQAKFEPSRYEQAFANCAMRITASASITDLDIRADLEKSDAIQIMNDKHFITLLSGVKMNDKQNANAKRLLLGINADQERESDSISYEGCTVEHILPKSSSHWDGWSGFSSPMVDPRDSIFRIGNLTILGTGDGRASSNADFATKKKAFEKSPIMITRDLSRYDDWTPKTVKDRSKEIASDAAKVWSFSKPRN